MRTPFLDLSDKDMERIIRIDGVYSILTSNSLNPSDFIGLQVIKQAKRRRYQFHRTLDSTAPDLFYTHRIQDCLDKHDRFQSALMALL